MLISLCPAAFIIYLVIAVLPLIWFEGAQSTDVKASLATDDIFSDIEAYLLCTPSKNGNQ